MHANVHTGQLSCQSKETRVIRHQFSNEAGESLSFMRKAKYIGSFLVTGSAHFERADIVRQKLEAARGYTQSKPILLVISLHGIKVCDDSGTSVHMAHALRRISYATCDPDCCQFAFLAREPKAQPNVQYCHAFVTKTPEEAENLNNLVGEAFRIAYAQQRALLENRRAVAQTQTSSLTTEDTAVIATSPHPHLQQPLPALPPPMASNPVPEADSGIATTDAASLRRKIDMVGYLAADLGLSSSESAPRGVKPCSLRVTSDNDAADDADKETHVKPCQGVGRLLFRPVLTSSSQSHCCQSLKDIATSTPNKCDKTHKQLRNSSDNPHCRSESHDSPTLSSAAVVDAVDASDYPDDLENIGIEEEEEADARFVQQPPSASHAVPLSMLPSHPRTIKEVDEVELADSLAAISGPVGRRRPTPFSLSISSPNAYDQASESFHSPPCPDPRRRRTATDAVSVSGSCSSGGGGGGSDSLKTSAGGISATPHVAPPISAPWYQPHIPRELALDMLSRQPPGSFVVRDSGTHSNCYALSVRVGGNESEGVHLHPTAAAERCLSAGMAPRTALAGGANSGGGGISHYLIQRTATGVRLKGLEKEWPSLACLILHLTVMPEMLPCPLLDAPQSSSNPAAFFRGGGASVHPAHFEQAPDACAFRPISARGGDSGPLTPSQQVPPPPPPHSEYQQLSEFSSLLADLNIPEERRRHRPHPPPPPPARIR